MTNGSITSAQNWSIERKLATALAALVGLMLLTVASVLEKKSEVASSLAGGSGGGEPVAQPQHAPESQSSRPQPENTGRVVAYRDVVERGENTSDPSSSPSSEPSPTRPSPQVPSPGSGDLGVDSLVVDATLPLREAPTVVDEFEVWLHQGNKLVGQYLTTSTFVKSSSGYVEKAFQISPRAIPVELTSEMKRIAREEVGYWSSQFKASVLLKEKGQGQIIRKTARRARREGRRFNPKRPSRHARKVSVDLRGGEVVITSVTWR
jgi:hypothetical protein